MWFLTEIADGFDRIVHKDEIFLENWELRLPPNIFAMKEILSLELRRQLGQDLSSQQRSVKHLLTYFDSVME
jgi:hypothetical protein